MHIKRFKVIIGLVMVLTGTACSHDSKSPPPKQPDENQKNVEIDLTELLPYQGQVSIVAGQKFVARQYETANVYTIELSRSTGAARIMVPAP